MNFKSFRYQEQLATYACMYYDSIYGQVHQKSKCGRSMYTCAQVFYSNAKVQRKHCFSNKKLYSFFEEIVIWFRK